MIRNSSAYCFFLCHFEWKEKSWSKYLQKRFKISHIRSKWHMGLNYYKGKRLNFISWKSISKEREGTWLDESLKKTVDVAFSIWSLTSKSKKIFSHPSRPFIWFNCLDSSEPSCSIFLSINLLTNSIPNYFRFWSSFYAEFQFIKDTTKVIFTKFKSLNTTFKNFWAYTQFFENTIYKIFFIILKLSLQDIKDCMEQVSFSVEVEP